MKLKVFIKRVILFIIVGCVVITIASCNNIKFRKLNRFDLMLEREISRRPNMPMRGDTIWTDSTNTYQLLFILIWDEYDYYLTKTGESKAFRLKPKGNRSIYEVCVFDDYITYLKESWSCGRGWVLIEGDEDKGFKNIFDLDWQRSFQMNTIPAGFSNHDTLQYLSGINLYSKGNFYKVENINKPGNYYVSGRDVLGYYDKKNLYNLANKYFR